MLLALLAGIVAQTCATMLPAATLEFEWFRDGRPYAQDILIRTRAGERIYQRSYEDGDVTERVVSCVRVNGATYLSERVGRGAPVRIPVGLERGAMRRVGNATVRRVAAPPDAAPSLVWFTVADPGVIMYGMRRAAGITEIRVPVRGGYSVLRALARNRTRRLQVDSQFSALAERVEELEAENRRLRDSLRLLRAPRPSPDTVRPRGTPPLRDSTQRNSTRGDSTRGTP